MSYWLTGQLNIFKPGNRGRADSRGPAMPGLLSIPLPLLHGISGGGGFLDELVVFGGIAILIGVLVFLSWRAGRERQRREGTRRRRRTR